MDDLEGCSIAEALARPIIKRVNNKSKLRIGDLREIGAFERVKGSGLYFIADRA